EMATRAQTPPVPQSEVPTLVASTAKSGVEISNRNGDKAVAHRLINSIDVEGGNSVGGRTDFTSSEKTVRNLAVNVKLRSSREPAQPYDVECFFFSRSKDAAMGIHDACKVQSGKDFDEILLTSKPLFGGEKEAQKMT